MFKINLTFLAIFISLFCMCVQKEPRIPRNNPLDPFGINYILPIDSSLVVYLPFSGNADNKSIYTITTIVKGASLTADRFGNQNSAYQFNGITNCIEVADSSVISFTNTQNFTVSFWLKTSSSKVNMLPVMKYRYNNPTGYFFVINHSAPNYCNGTGIISFVVGTGSPACDSIPINDNLWHHIVGTYSASENILTLYVDGIAKTKTGKRAYDLPVQSPLLIGGLPNIYPYEGCLDDIRIYNRILSSSEILSLYHEKGWQL